MRIQGGPLALVVLAALAVTVGCRGSWQGSAGSAPATRKGTDATTFFGVTVPDPYRWLEDGASPEVQQWIDAQNAHADSVLGSFPESAAMTKRVQELATTSSDRSSPQISGSMLFYLRETPPSPQPVLVAQAWPSGSERTLVDVNAAGGTTAISDYWPSPSGRYVAYGTAEGGSELTTIRFRDVASGETLHDALPYAGGGTSPQALAWDSDERGATYARYPLPDANQPVSPFDTALYHHTLGSPDADPLVFGEGYSRIAEYRLLTSADGKHAAALVNKGDGGPADVFLRAPGLWQRVLDASAGVTVATYVGDRLLVVVTGAAPRGRIVSVTPDGRVSDLVKESDWGVQFVAALGSGFLVVRSSGPVWRVDQYASNGTLVRVVPLPADGVHIREIASGSSSDAALIAYSGWTLPTRWARYDGRSGTLTTIFDVKPAADYSRVKAQVIEATSKDGTKIPVSILSLDDRPRDGAAPTILYGYGGFQNPLAPSFIGANFAWIERGGVLAYAHVRGGNEFGEAWHQGGMLTQKQHVFDDFHAAAQALVAGGMDEPVAARRTRREQRRPPDGRPDHAASRDLPGRRRLRGHLRHPAPPDISQRRLQRDGVRHDRQRGAVHGALRVFAAPSRASRHEVSGRAPRDRRERPARGPVAVAQVRRGARGGDLLPTSDRPRHAHGRGAWSRRPLQPARRQLRDVAELFRARTRARTRCGRGKPNALR